MCGQCSTLYSCALCILLMFFSWYLKSNWLTLYMIVVSSICVKLNDVDSLNLLLYCTKLTTISPKSSLADLHSSAAVNCFYLNLFLFVWIIILYLFFNCVVPFLNNIERIFGLRICSQCPRVITLRSKIPLKCNVMSSNILK